MWQRHHMICMHWYAALLMPVCHMHAAASPHHECTSSSPAAWIDDDGWHIMHLCIWHGCQSARHHSHGPMHNMVSHVGTAASTMVHAAPLAFWQ